MKILMVLTSNDKLGNLDEKTGFWLEEFAAPYYIFKDSGAEITLSSPLGGLPPLDPKSKAAEAQTDFTRRFMADSLAQAVLGSTHKLSEVDANNFDAVFYPGGHGLLWDLVKDENSIALIETLLCSGKPVVTVCHAPAVLHHTKSPEGTPVVKGKGVTGFSNTEEDEVGLSNAVPFLVEDMLKKNGGAYSKAANWAPFVVADDLLITGQNAYSSELVAKALLEKLDLIARLKQHI
jgi:putative intracellular protease/amidase